MLTNYTGVKKRAEIQQGMESRRAQGRDGLTGEHQKKTNASDQRSRKMCPEEKIWKLWGIQRKMAFPRTF